MSDYLKDLAEFSFEGIRFPAQAAETMGGNDFVKHVAYRRRGADVEYTGQRAYSGSFTIPLVNSPQLVARYGDLASGVRYDLLNAFETTPIGSLQHPTYGLITAAIEEWSEPIDAGVRNGFVWTVKWSEHNATAGLLLGPDGALPTDTDATVETRAETADTLGASVAGYRPTAPTARSQMTFLASAPRSYTQVNDAFRQMTDVVAFNLALPGMVGPASNAATRALLDLRSAIDDLRGRYVIGDGRRRYYTVPSGMALWEVSLAVYGTAARVRDLLGANTITDPLAVPAGTVVTVLP